MGRSHMLLISNPSMSLVVALLMMFVSDVLSQTELAPNSCVAFNDGTSFAEANAVTALYTGWGILSAMGGDECPDPSCLCGWEGVICVTWVLPAVAPAYCTVYGVLLLEIVILGLRGNLSGAIGNLTNLQGLTISGNPGLTGNLPPEIGSLTNLQFLDLSYNQFNGSILPSIWSEIPKLNVLNLSNNKLYGKLPTMKDMQHCPNSLKSFYNSHEFYQKLTWIFSAILPIFVLVGGIFFIIIYWKYHKNMLAFLQPILYSYNVLKLATNDFHPSNKLGEGGFGAVYKGILLDGTNVAVKLLNKSHQQVSEFLNEIVLMTGVRHKNLVKVKGCSLRGTQRLIVFEFVENKNLAEALWDRNIKNVLFLDWTMRFNICVGIAHGLIYLHEYLQPRIIHRDIKASNILLDKDLNPKIADFGLARLFLEDISHLSTAHIAGIMGYLSPEYATFGKLTEKVDVFSYGVLLLEIVSGRKSNDLSLETNKIYLLEWAHSLHEQNKLFDLIDQQLNNNVLDDEAQRVIDVALLCVQTSASRRPLMSHVLAMLLNEVDMEVVPKKANSIHEMDFSNLLGFHHVVPNNHGNVEIELSTLDPN
ncbi:unnamed protein product [Sphagnum compactum]